MDLELAIQIGQMALWNALMISLPLLGAGMIVGLAISLFQTATSIQEQTMTFAPKIASLILVLIFGGSWIIERLMSFTLQMWDLLTVVGSP
jgi:flagellar biosynthetic protein FliQ